ncbi:hypothetical protein MUK42_15004 [Musa troglodytarum]|uniref:Uncharacterized protein n=1 Tax=Musa troglodytarum TaxID=320322 RepID=A0A9E7G3F7_9LILI|nr:hypothetical protein MUK42_15004 [Musa troglodytarum]
MCQPRTSGSHGHVGRTSEGEHTTAPLRRHEPSPFLLLDSNRGGRAQKVKRRL